MSKYISRFYLMKKWDSLKWDIEKVIDVYNEYSSGDGVDEKTANSVKKEIFDLMDAIKKELG